jgi:hypothetical protein
MNGTVIYQSSTAGFTDDVLALQIGNDTANQPFTLVADNVPARN